MNYLEAIGMAWIVLTSSLATIGIFYFAWVGVQTLSAEHKSAKEALSEVYNSRT